MPQFETSQTSGSRQRVFPAARSSGAGDGAATRAAGLAAASRPGRLGHREQVVEQVGGALGLCADQCYVGCGKPAAGG